MPGVISQTTMDWKIQHREAIQESIRFLGREGKFDRETWVVSRLLVATGIPFQFAELISPDEPADVAFRDAQFQVKELMEPDRRRHDELRQKLRDLEAAKSETDLLERYAPLDITFSDVVDQAVTKAHSLESTKYGPAECASLDLLCYFNWLDYTVLPPLIFDEISTSFRSLSVVSNTYCAVLFASDDAPDFLKTNLGRVSPILAGDT